MKKIRVTTLILAVLLLTGCRGTGTDLSETTAQPAGKVSTEDSLRPLYGLGSCQNFSGKLAAVTFYLDDSESSWDPEAIRAYNALFKEGYAYLEQAAGQWDTEHPHSPGSQPPSPAHPGSLRPVHRSRQRRDSADCSPPGRRKHGAPG